MTFPNGSEYVGGFKYGRFNGNGTFTFVRPAAEGGEEGGKVVLEGVWDNGMKEGKFMLSVGGAEPVTILYRANVPQLSAGYPGGSIGGKSYFLDVCGDMVLCGGVESGGTMVPPFF